MSEIPNLSVAVRGIMEKVYGATKTENLLVAAGEASQDTQQEIKAEDDSLIINQRVNHTNQERHTVK